ncbi:MAG TPA: hypothetical protein VJX94_27740 [Stellaceae bacterium]|nr:hypothetical protein [Stellaceae bacterium]
MLAYTTTIIEDGQIYFKTWLILMIQKGKSPTLKWRDCLFVDEVCGRGQPLGPVIYGQRHTMSRRTRLVRRHKTAHCDLLVPAAGHLAQHRRERSVACSRGPRRQVARGEERQP